MTSCVVDVSHVSLFYQEPQSETLAVSDLSFSVSQGEFVAIVGPSGCGKTSVLSLLSGLLMPSGGSVSVTGGRERVGYMLQRDHLFDWRSVRENVLLGLEVKKLCTKERIHHTLSLLDTYGLTDFADSYPRQLSGGMRQKVALIRTLAFDPTLLLLDEPFSSLDYQTRLRAADEIHGIIKSEKKTAILVTHDISEAVSMSDRVLVFTERPARLLADHRLAFPSHQSPLERRNSVEFPGYFETIWKELMTYAN